MPFKIVAPVKTYVKPTIEGTPLEIAVEVRHRLAAQDYKQCASKGGGGGCRMRMVKDGITTKCALGVLLPDECFTGLVYENGVAELIGEFSNGSVPSKFFNLTAKQARTISILQTIHDGSPTPEVMHKALNAFIYGLEICDVK